MKDISKLLLAAVFFGALAVALAAPGDLNAPSPTKPDPGLVLEEVCFSRTPSIKARWRDSGARVYEATVANGSSVGFDYSTGDAVVVSTPTGFNTTRAAFGMTNATVTAGTAAIRTLGLAPGSGTAQ